MIRGLPFNDSIISFFQQFRKDTIIEEEGGKSLNGISVFSLALKYLRSHFLDALGVGDKYSSSDTLAKGYAARYVITVPTKWDNYAIDCMKAAAKKVSYKLFALSMVNGSSQVKHSKTQSTR